MYLFFQIAVTTARNKAFCDEAFAATELFKGASVIIFYACGVLLDFCKANRKLKAEEHTVNINRLSEAESKTGYV